MAEPYVRPVVRAREPAPSWLPVWRFRIVVVALIVLLAFTAIEVFRRYVDPNRAQDPGIGSDTGVITPPPG